MSIPVAAAVGEACDALASRSAAYRLRRWLRDERQNSDDNKFSGFYGGINGGVAP